MSQLRGILTAERARGGPFTIRKGGQAYTLVDATTIPFERLVVILRIGALGGLPAMTLAEREEVYRRWLAHYDLLDWQSANRLLYLVDRYYDDLETDLRIYSQVDLGEAWRSRRWRFLLAAIDRLPGNSYYAEAVSKDEEHAKLLAEMKVNGDAPSGPASPPVRIWTPEYQLMTKMYDQMRSMEHTMFVLKVGANKAGKPPAPSPTPISTVAKRAEHEMRKARHDALAKRLLPHKR